VGRSAPGGGLLPGPGWVRAADAPGWAVNGLTALLVTLADTIKFAE